jgi:hypothetical protein
MSLADLESKYPLQILSVSVFEKTQISCALQPDSSQATQSTNANLLILFNF